MRYTTGHFQLPENRDREAKRLEDGAQSNAGKASANEVVGGGGRRSGTAGHVLLAALVEDVLEGDSDEDGDCERSLVSLNGGDTGQY
jgi:hypothetical protein